jgi:DNA-directed RNA polymerase specialized sigma24 family protein
MHRRFLSEAEESGLLDAAIAADNEAWGTLYSSFVLPVRGFIAGRIGVIEDAEDLAQECFIRAQKSLEEGSFDRQFRFYTFLRSIAAHLVQDYWRHRSRLTDHHRECSAEEQETDSDCGPSLDPYARLELLRLVFSCGAKPHQILMFGFVRLLEWRPREIVTERADHSLESLLDEFLSLYYVHLERFLSKKMFHGTYCSPILQVIDRPVQEIYVEHEYEAMSMPPATTVGRITLKTFFRRDPAASISDWCDRVKTRTRKLLAATNMKANSGSLPDERECE